MRVVLSFLVGVLLLLGLLNRSVPALGLMVVCLVVLLNLRKRTLSVFSGIVSFRQREIDSFRSGASSGQGGMPIRQLPTSQHSQPESAVTFRVTAFDSSGNVTGEAAVEFRLNKNDVYVQEGDMVTIIGFGKNAFLDPAILNHTSGTITVPGGSTNTHRKIIWCLVAWGALVSFFLALALSDLTSERKTAPFVLVPIAILSVWLIVLCRRWRRMSRLRHEIKPMTASWKPQLVRNPEGIVEGFSTFQRCQKSGTGMDTWGIFRMALYDGRGEVALRIVAAVPESRLSAALRVGEWVRLPGEFRTGEIARPHSVEIGALHSKGA